MIPGLHEDQRASSHTSHAHRICEETRVNLVKECGSNKPNDYISWTLPLPMAGSKPVVYGW